MQMEDAPLSNNCPFFHPFLLDRLICSTTIRRLFSRMTSSLIIAEKTCGDDGIAHIDPTPRITQIHNYRRVRRPHGHMQGRKNELRKVVFRCRIILKSASSYSHSHHRLIHHLQQLIDHHSNHAPQDMKSI